jgi:hypothetical protein
MNSSEGSVAIRLPVIEQPVGVLAFRHAWRAVAVQTFK